MSERASTSSSTAATAEASPRKPAPATLQQVVENILVESGCLRTFMINFLLVYNARFGVALVARLATLATTSPRTLLDLGEILSERHLQFREEAVRMGLFVATFGAVVVAVKRALHLYDEDRAWYSSAIGGTAAGALCFHWMDASWHRTLALYSATRAAQCFYNFSKTRGYFHFWGSSWPHGDSLLFAVSSAQIMYSYVMRPQALPAAYYHFIRKQGPLAEVVLQSVRDACRGNAVNTVGLFDYVEKTAGAGAVDEVKRALARDATTIPTRALYATAKSPLESAAKAFANVFRQIIGVYFSLALAPQVVLQFQRFIKTPGQTVWHAVLSAIQSSIFLATFCGGYQFLIVVVQRPLLAWLGKSDHKLWYWLAGLVASSSILIERKSRRSELALYAFPRAADALYSVLMERRLVTSVPQGEMLLFAMSMGVLTFFLEHDPSCLSPAVVSVLGRFLPKHHSHPRHHHKEGKDLPAPSPSPTEFGQEPLPSTPRMLSLGGSSLVAS